MIKIVDELPNVALAIILSWAIIQYLKRRFSANSSDRDEIVSHWSSYGELESFKYETPGELISVAMSQRDPIEWARQVLKHERQQFPREDVVLYQQRLRHLKMLEEFMVKKSKELEDPYLAPFVEFLDSFEDHS